MDVLSVDHSREEKGAIFLVGLQSVDHTLEKERGPGSLVDLMTVDHTK